MESNSKSQEPDLAPVIKEAKTDYTIQYITLLCKYNLWFCYGASFLPTERRLIIMETLVIQVSQQK